MVLEHAGEYGSQWGATSSISGKAGCTAKQSSTPPRVDVLFREAHEQTAHQIVNQRFDLIVISKEIGC